jgi:hypothetical protein
VGPFGLKYTQAFFPALGNASEVTIAVLTFADYDTITSALASPATETVLGDLVNFTTIAQELSTGQPLT